MDLSISLSQRTCQKQTEWSAVCTHSQKQHEIRCNEKFVAADYAKNLQLTAQTTRFKSLICTSRSALTTTK
jgi:hypothetical protein